MQIGHAALQARWARLVRKIRRAPRGTYESLEPSQAPPLTIFCGGAAAKNLFFFTKDVLCRRWLQDGDFPEDWIALSRHSIPGHQYVDEIVAQAERWRLPLFFVGDLDPLDLTIFMQLRGALGTRRRPARLGIRYAGVSDGWLALSDRHLRRGKLRSSALIEMEPLEREHLDWVRAMVPDLEALVGPRSLSLLLAGWKLEIEGASALDLHGERFPRQVLRYLRRCAAQHRRGSRPLERRSRFVAAVEEGLADAEAGRIHSHAAIARRVRSRFGGKAK